MSLDQFVQADCHTKSLTAGCMQDGASQVDSIGEFIGRWTSSGAAERANDQLFLCELCDVIGVSRPDPAKADSARNAYVFEHPFLFDDGLGRTTTKFIDLYRRGSFILEAKQGSDKEGFGFADYSTRGRIDFTPSPVRRTELDVILVSSR